MQIRKFKKEDAKACSKIISETVNIDQSLTEEAANHIKKETRPEALIKKMKRIQYFVCEEDCQILGIGLLDSNEVKTMYVLSEFQNKRVGTKILESIEKYAKSKNIKKLILYTHPKAEYFYLKNRFITIKKFKDGKMDVVYMEKSLKCK